MFEIQEATVTTIQSALNNNLITSFDLVEQYLKRIATIDKSGPKLNSIIEVNPDAIYIAQAMDRERQSGIIRSPLHGIPILLKDNINTNDKMHTSAGALALDDNYASFDAFIVTKLREAGLVIIGKTNMTEMANFMAYNMKNGYSSRGGQVINPYKRDGDTWGSSSGSAVAMAANLASLSIGTETDGSIIWPSNNNSIVGLKPTRGLISRYGIIPICSAQDTAGPMTRNVEDTASLLNILVGCDPNDPSTWGQKNHIPDDYTDYLRIDGIVGKKVGFNLGYEGDWSEEQRELSKYAKQIFIDAGADVVDVDLPHQKNDFQILLHEFKQCLNSYLSTTATGNKCRSLEEIIHFNEKHAEKCL
ncbi:MAG: amidase, partial [Clostridiales bacterium]|nr:amidase [Clostridiales bacterium]